MRKHALCLIALALLLTAVFPAAAHAQTNTQGAPAAQTGGLVITGYRVLVNGTPKDALTKGETVTLELSLMDTTVKTSEVGGKEQLDVSRLVDSFSTALPPRVDLLSSGDEPLRVLTTFDGCVYSGTGKAFRLMLGYRSLTRPYEQQELNVVECVEYVPPVALPSPVPTAAPAVAIPAPALRLVRSEVPTLSPGDETDITLAFTNAGVAGMENALATVAASEGLLLLNNASSFPLGSVPRGGTVYLTLRFKAAKTISSQQQTITAELKFSYYNGESMAQGTASDKVNLLAEATDPNAAKLDGPVPNIILQKYAFGDAAQVAAGAEFDLTLDFVNTSEKKKLENIVMLIEPGEGLSLSNSSNTFYYAALGRSEAKSETVRLQALSSAKPGVAGVNVTFKYEYVDNSKRVPVTLAQKISIPVFQPDRFEATAAKLPDVITAGEELTLTVNYMNKGKSDVSNVQAELVGDIPSLGTLQNLGNFEPGKSGSINFVLTPQEAGAASCKVKITYEDASGGQQARELPVSFTVEDAAPEQGMEDVVFEEDTARGGGLLWYIAGAGALCCGAAVFLALKRKRAAAKRQGRKKTYEWHDEV